MLGPRSWFLGAVSWMMGVGGWELGVGSWVWVLGACSWGSGFLVFGSWYLGAGVLGFGKISKKSAYCESNSDFWHLVSPFFFCFQNLFEVEKIV